MNVNDWLFRKYMLCLVWKRKHKKNQSTLIFCLLSFLLSEFLYFYLNLSFEYPKRGINMEEWMDPCTNTQGLNVFWHKGPLLLDLWAKHPAVFDPPPLSPGWPCGRSENVWISSGSALTPDLSPAWMDRVEQRREPFISWLPVDPSVLLSQSSP